MNKDAVKPEICIFIREVSQGGASLMPDVWCEA